VDNLRNKILVVEHEEADRVELESILQEVIEEGGELIFSQKKEEALEILHKQHPIIVLIESKYIEEDPQAWHVEGVHIILIYPHGAKACNQEHIFKPFNPHQILEKCSEYLSREFVPPIPPM
jgi:hypothetical protein